MGTFFEADLRVAPGDVSSARRWLDWARAEIARLEAVCSRHDPASALSTLNHALASPVSTRSGLRVAPALEAFLSAARAVWKASGGAFDPTVGPLVEVWRSAALEGVWPSDQAIERARQRVGSEQILPGGGGSLNVTTEGLQLDLDGLSKGFVLDRLRARLVAELPEASALIHFGQSSVMAIGDPDGRRSGGGWRLAVHSRGDSPRRLVTVALRDKALSVSSSVGRINRIGGEPVSHVVDPRTGRPVDGEVEAVVIADRGDRADGWSTALLVLGARSESVRLAERAGVAAFVFESADRVRTTFDWDGFEAR
jgi:thiamine biosynthesis lipoprotein